MLKTKCVRGPGLGRECDCWEAITIIAPDEVLSRKDLAELQHRLTMMSGTAVEDFYRSAHMVCRIAPGHFPSARAIQELVQAWKQMRKWR